jgi:hypothetical protein
MKLFVPLFVLLAGPIVHGQENARVEEIIRKRGALLEEIHQMAKKSQTSDPEQARASALELFCFRRDTAKTLPEKLKWQNEILAMLKAEFDNMKRHAEIGVMRQIDVSRAEERMLASEQKLLEMQQAK